MATKQRSKGSAGTGAGSTAPKLFLPAFLDVRVTLTPRELHDAATNIDDFLLSKLRRQLEEKCCVHGFVRKGSTQILSRSMGQAEHARYTGDFLFVCKVRVGCFLPEAGQIVDAKILMINKAGAYALLVDNNRVSEAIRIIIPRDMHMGNTEFDSLTADQVIRVKLLGSRFQENDMFIRAVGHYEGASSVTVVSATEDGGDAVPPSSGARKRVASALPPAAGAGGAAAAGAAGVKPDAPTTRANFARILLDAAPDSATAGVKPDAPATRANFARILSAAGAAGAAGAASGPPRDD